MSVNLERKPFSLPEFLGGGIALASVALIAFVGLHDAEPQNALQAPARYASVSIQSSEALATSSVEPPRLSVEQPPLSVEQPRAPSDVTGATRDVQSPDTGVGTANATPIESNDAQAPRPLAADLSAAPIAGRPVGLRTQQHGVASDAPTELTEAIWERPLSNQLHDSRLRDSRLANNQPRTVPDPPSARADPTFIGGWAEDIGLCRTGRKAPLVINSRVAKTAYGECDFGFVTREAPNRWRVAAICAAEGKFWRANIALKLTEPNLTWSSARGTLTYVRCKR
jgi:hypothetical protein